MPELIKDSLTSYEAFKESFRNGVNVVNNKALDLPTLIKEAKDTITTSNFRMWLPQVISEVMKEAIEPTIVLTHLLDRVPVIPGVQTVTMAIGAIDAADIAEGESYPEKQLQFGGATSTAQVGKSGLRFKMTEEVIARSQFNIIQAHLNAGAKALARWKETKVANYLANMGVQVFNNESPTSALLGVTTGRSASGAANGSFTWDDLFDLFGVVINNGFLPNTIIMHPLMWTLWMKDPVLRTFAQYSGGGTWWGAYQGQPNAPATWGGPKTHTTRGQNITPGGAASGASPSPLADYPAYMNASPVMPSYFLPWPVNVIVSPFMYYDTATKITDIIVCDSNLLGALLVEEEPSVDERDLFDTDMHEIKMKEKYAIMIYEEGLGIAVAKSVKAIENHIVLPAKVNIDAASLPTITATVAIY